MKKILSVLFLLPIAQITAFADSVTGVQKIKDVIGYCGKMPVPMIIGFAILAILAAVTVVTLKKKGEVEK